MSLAGRFPGVRFYNAALTEVQEDVGIGDGSHHARRGDRGRCLRRPRVITLNGKKMDGSLLEAPVIRRGAKVGGGAVILPGIEIGRNAVVGNPARPVKPGSRGQASRSDTGRR